MIRIEMTVDPVAQNSGLRRVDFVIGKDIINSTSAFPVDIETGKCGARPQWRDFCGGKGVVKRG